MKSVIIYTYYNSPSSNYNLAFFLKREVVYRDNIDYIFVVNGFETDKSIVFPILDNVTVIRRENIGFDFGGHASALEHIKTKDKVYDYYFFMNSGVIGPILPHYVKTPHWSHFFIEKINDTVKLVGTTITCLPDWDDGRYGPKVEGFFFMVDQIALDILKLNGTIFYNHPTKVSAIINGEYGISNCILNNGYSIDCMLRKYQGIDWRDRANYKLNNNKSPSRSMTFYNNSINPYEVIFHKWFWYGQNTVNYNIIVQHVNNNT
jgi:hypothetical protein